MRRAYQPRRRRALAVCLPDSLARNPSMVLRVFLPSDLLRSASRVPPRSLVPAATLEHNKIGFQSPGCFHGLQDRDHVARSCSGALQLLDQILDRGAFLEVDFVDRLVLRLHRRLLHHLGGSTETMGLGCETSTWEITFTLNPPCRIETGCSRTLPPITTVPVRSLTTTRARG